jgi:hypothetical protein
MCTDYNTVCKRIYQWEETRAISAKHGRIGKAKIYDFKKKRHGIYYEQKRFEVFYIIEENVMVTVTVYVFCGKWEA